MRDLPRELRHAVRGLLRAPAFAAGAILTIAVGIAANTAVFSVVHGTMLRPLPYREADRVVSVWPDEVFSKREFADRRGLFAAYDAMALWTRWVFTATGEGPAEKVQGVRATAELFRVLGVDAAVGRGFRDGDDRPGRDRIAVISHGYWQRRFGGDPAVVGRTLTLDGVPHEIVGLMPAGFFFPTADRDLWVPAPLDPAATNDYAAGYLLMIGRLRPDAGLPTARGEMAVVVHRIRAIEPVPADYGTDATVEMFRTHLLGATGPALLVVWGAVGLVLLLVSVNVANLLLVRGVARRSELDIRAMLGAGRGRIARLLISEAVVLGTVGGVLGVAAAAWAVDILRALIPADVALLGNIRVDWRVAGFGLGLSVLTGIACSVVPALRLASKPGITMRGTRSATATRRVVRVQGALVVVEVALAAVLLVGAGLLAKSFWRLQTVEPGFRSDGVLAVRMDPPRARYGTPDARRLVFGTAVAEFAALPGVTAVGGIVTEPLGSDNFAHRLEIEGRPLPDRATPPTANWRTVTPGYFRTMGIALRQGRGFTEADDARAEPVAIVNATMARQHWPDGSPIGQRVRTGFEGPNWVTIVGVVDDVRQHALSEPARPELYRPFAQYTYFDLTVMLRTAGDPRGLVPGVRSVLNALDPDIPQSDIVTMDSLVTESVAKPRFYAALMVAFATLAVIVGAVGLFGVLSYAVSSRTREIGLRVALGAHPAAVRRMAIRRGLGLATAGLALGLLSGMWLSRFLQQMLFQVPTRDPLTFAGVAASLLVVATAAVWLPARRAARVAPMEALRHE